MKKNNISLVCLIFMISICGCKQNPRSIDKQNDTNIVSTDKTDERKSISNLNGKELSDVIEFGNNCTALAFNKNNEFDMNHSINVYGTFLVSEEAEQLKDKIGEKINNVSLYSNDNLIISAKRMRWNFVKADQGIDFVLEIPVEDLNYSENIEVTKIVFGTPTETFDKEVDHYYIMPYSDIDNKVRVIESPIAPRVKIEKDSYSAYSYIILTANPQFNKDFKADIVLPDEIKKFIEINSIDIVENDEMAKELQKTLNAELTLQQKKDLKVYSINVIYHFEDGERIALQPLIKLNITGKEQVIAPFCPIDLTLKK